MIYTSSYETSKLTKHRMFSISGDRGALVDYKGACYPILAPKLSFWEVWKNNIGKLSEEENTKFYIENYYKEVLSKLTPEAVFATLDDSILLCYEDDETRHIVAAWFELFLDLNVPEIVVKGREFVSVERPEYIKEYLEEIIKENTDMKGFNSVRGVYLYNKGEVLEEVAIRLERSSGKNYDGCRKNSDFYKEMANAYEKKYNEANSVKSLKING